MAKVKIEKKTDYTGRRFWMITKARGSITRAEMYEAMAAAGLYGRFLIDFGVPEETPTEIYDGPEWFDVYRPEDIFGEITDDIREKAFGDGYEAAQRDTGQI